jgi:hypothetical protein
VPENIRSRLTVMLVKESGKLSSGIGVTFGLILLCMVAGCMHGSTLPLSADAGQDNSGNSDLSAGDDDNGQTVYFSVDCNGQWRSSGNFADPEDYHGSFTAAGTILFPMTYDYHGMKEALYVSRDMGKADGSNPLHVTAESYGCYHDGSEDCVPCHFVFDGDVYVSGNMVYNGSEGPDRLWTVQFMEAMGPDGLLHVNSLRQTEPGCPVVKNNPSYEESMPFLLTDPVSACYQSAIMNYWTGRAPFTFADGSPVVVSPAYEPGDDRTITSLNQGITFHTGAVPFPSPSATESQQLRANPGGPYTAVRGTPLQLDGSRSTGSITGYAWTFSPGSGCPAGLSLGSAELAGSRPSATFLCPVTATLTVTDGKSSDSASVPVAVPARDWTTPFSMSGEGIDTGAMATPPWFNSPGYAGYEGGANICGLCQGTEDENTGLHPPAQGGSWEPSGGYRLAQVTEPGGPFDRYWYVAEYGMEMNRMIVVNPYVLPPASGGRELPYGMGYFYGKNRDSGYDADGYLAGIRQHEQDHADRMKAALAAKDPAKAIEPLSGTDPAAIRDTADSTLRGAEKDICTASSDASQPPMRVTWTGRMVFPTSDTNEWKEGETSVGGYRQDAGESCG